MSSARDFLLRGLLAGLIAGVLAFAVAYVVGEPSVNAAIAYEESHVEVTNSAVPPVEAAPADGHGQASGDTVVPRSLQSTLGLLTATAVAGVAIGGVLGVLCALALGRFGGLSVRSTTLALAAAGFVSLYLLPYLAYPPNPPAVGQEGTIGYRSALYFVMLAISVIAAVTAVLVGRRMAPRWGAWYATLACVGGYLLVTLVAAGLLPDYDEVPADFPAVVLSDFRLASLATQFTLWASLGLVLAELLHRLTRRTGTLARARSQYAA